MISNSLLIVASGVMFMFGFILFLSFRFLKIGIHFLFLPINLQSEQRRVWIVIWSCNGRSKLERGSWGLIRRRRHGRSNLSPRNAGFEAPNPKLFQFCIGLCSRRLGHSLLLQGLLSQSRRPSLSGSAPQTPTSLSVPFSLVLSPLFGCWRNKLKPRLLFLVSVIISQMRIEFRLPMLLCLVMIQVHFLLHNRQLVILNKKKRPWF